MHGILALFGVDFFVATCEKGALQILWTVGLLCPNNQVINVGIVGFVRIMSAVVLTSMVRNLKGREFDRTGAHPEADA